MAFLETFAMVLAWAIPIFLIIYLLHGRQKGGSGDWDDELIEISPKNKYSRTGRSYVKRAFRKHGTSFCTAHVICKELEQDEWLSADTPQELEQLLEDRHAENEEAMKG